MQNAGTISNISFLGKIISFNDRDKLLKPQNSKKNNIKILDDNNSKKEYKKRPEAKKPLNQLFSPYLLKMFEAKKVDYFNVKMQLEEFLSSSEKQVFEFILQRTIKLKTAFCFISYSDFTDGIKSGRKIYTKGINLDISTIKKCLKNLESKNILFRHRFDRKNPYLYILNFSKGKEFYDLILENKINYNDCEHITFLILKEKKSFLELDFIEELSNNESEKFIQPIGIINSYKKPETIDNKELKYSDFLPKKINNKNTNKKVDTVKEILTEYKIEQTNEKNLIELLTNFEYEGNNIGFSQSIAQTLIRNNAFIKSTPIEEVISNQLKWLPFRNPESLRKYGIAKMLYSFIKENSPCPEEYSFFIRKKDKNKISEKYLSILEIWDNDSNYSTITEENARFILSQIIIKKYKNLIYENIDSNKEELEDIFCEKVLKTLKITTLESCFREDILKDSPEKIDEMLDYVSKRSKYQNG